MDILLISQSLPHRPSHSRQVHIPRCRPSPSLADTEMDIILIIVSRTGTPRASTIATVTSLLTLRTTPPRIDSSRKHASKPLAPSPNSTFTPSNVYITSFTTSKHTRIRTQRHECTRARTHTHTHTPNPSRTQLTYHTTSPRGGSKTP
jgi:hypothetical protein